MMLCVPAAICRPQTTSWLTSLQRYGVQTWDLRQITLSVLALSVYACLLLLLTESWRQPHASTNSV
jgi:hypothetical protein